MLNPPPDVPCPCKSNGCDERASPKQLALPDLPKGHTPLFKFSIRDYVVTSRTKDIKKNWPFSLKNLQLCLKHGVKDVLPPFGSTDTTTNQSLVRCAVGTDLAEDNNCLSKIDGSSCRSGGEVGTSLIEVGGPVYQSQKKENTCRLPGKKCRLIVKFGGNFNCSSTKDIASNTTTVSETMASKVCPVCKTFSSSSNTTLNAHIDQCLSGESTPKWTSDFKLTRNRIKPRKTRLMVDVYSTAKRCTLEELDIRNGTDWATISSLPSQHTMTLTAEGRKQRVSQVHPEEVDDVGAVYIDSSGTKVRILSKLSGVEPRKPFKEGKVHKLFSTKKKIKHVLKHQKYLKLTPQSKKLQPYEKAHMSQIYGGQEKFDATKVDWEKSRIIQNLRSFEHAHSSESGTLGTGLARKVKSKGGRQPLRCELHLASDILVETNQLNSNDSVEDRRTNSSENAGEFRSRMESSSREAYDCERQWFPRKKRMRSSLRVNRDAEWVFSSSSQSPGIESKFHDPKKGSACKNSQMRLMAEMMNKELMQTCTVNRSGREYVGDDEASLDKRISTSQRDEDVDGERSNDFSGREIDDLSDEYDSIEFTHCEDTVLEDDSSSKVAERACLRKSLDPKFHKVGSCMKIQSDSQELMEDYDEPLCGEKLQTCTNEPNLVDGPVMFSGNVVVNGIHVQSSHELNCEAEQGNSFLEVDPIPIPGPPGSFLPSPGGEDDSSEENFQGNSSLTTGQFQSSQDQLELVNNRGSSDSPVSATSSINSAAARFDVNYIEPFPTESCMVKDKFRAGFDIETSVETGCTEAEKIDVDGESLKPSNDDQLCCCSRKDGVTQGAALNYEEPQLLRRQTFSVEKQMSGDPNSRPDDIRSEIFPLSLGSERVCSRVASDVGVKFCGRSDCDLAIPSAPNPVLRLMGKNLMVANKDEDMYSTSQVQVEAPSSSVQNNHPTSQFQSVPCNIQNQDYNPLIDEGQGVVNLSHSSVLQPFDGRKSNGFQFQKQHVGGSYAEPDEYRGECILMTRARNRPSGAFLEKTGSNSAANKEIIIIDDDDTESEAGKLVKGSRESHPTLPKHGLPYANPYHFQATPSARRANTTKWSCTSEGPPGMVQRTLYNGAVPPPTSHLRSSTLYYSPSFS